jgi:hypothetical protein
LPVSRINIEPLLRSISAAVEEQRMTKAEKIAPMKVEIGNKTYFLNPKIR